MTATETINQHTATKAINAAIGWLKGQKFDKFNSAPFSYHYYTETPRPNLEVSMEELMSLECECFEVVFFKKRVPHGSGVIFIPYKASCMGIEKEFDYLK